MIIIISALLATAFAAPTERALHRPLAGTAEYETAKTYFVKWANPLLVSVPIEICDWTPDRKIAALEVPQAALFTSVMKPVLLIEEKGVKRKIWMKSLGIASSQAEQVELDHILKLCAGPR
jgi:hypothetical protein